MDGTLQDIQGLNFFFYLLEVVISVAQIQVFCGKVQVLNSEDRPQNQAENT